MSAVVSPSRRPPPSLPVRGEASALVRRLDGAPDPLTLYRSLSEGGSRPGTLLFETADKAAGERARSLVMPAAALVATCRGRRVHLTPLTPNGESALAHILDRASRIAQLEPLLVSDPDDSSQGLPPSGVLAAPPLRAPVPPSVAPRRGGPPSPRECASPELAPRASRAPLGHAGLPHSHSDEGPPRRFAPSPPSGGVRSSRDMAVVASDQGGPGHLAAPVGRSLLAGGAALVFPPRSEEDDLAVRLSAPSPLDALRAMVSFRVQESATPHAVFCAGVFAYDLIDAFEALPPAAHDPLGYPDYVFYLAESLVVIEPATGHTTVVCTAFGDDDPSRARALHNDAASRLAALVERCRACAATGLAATEPGQARSSTSDHASRFPATEMAGGRAESEMAHARAESEMAGARAESEMAGARAESELAGARAESEMAGARAESEMVVACPESVTAGERAERGAVRVDMGDAEYARGVAALKEHIARGDVFQIVPSRTFSAPCPSPIRAYEALRAGNPSPYMFYLAAPDHTLFGASPETSVRVTRTAAGAFEMEIRPIAGTRRRGRTAGGALDPDLDNRREAELLLDEKERAEHMMLVDLARNDVARACRAGTRRVERLLTVERFSHVMHLVSRVTGELRPGQDALGAYAAAMNMGTLVGAPKVRAAELLRAHERTKRGPYGGAIGYFTAEGELDTAVVIRSAVVKEGVAHVRAGAGVVHDSDPAAEADETRRKAASVLEALRAAAIEERALHRQAPASEDGSRAEQASTSGGQGSSRREQGSSSGGQVSSSAPVGVSVEAVERGERVRDVLFVDNFDSFTFNLVDAFERLGCRVRVVRNTARARAVVDDARAARALVVLSPGPGAPEEAGSCLEIIAAAKGVVPLLGVCLGHQAIVKEAGGVVERADAVVHGKASRLHHDGLGPFRGVPDPLIVGRYHSLATKSIPERLHVHASLAGMAMAVSDPVAGQIGFQFHPESLLTPAGQTLLQNVLAAATERRPR